ncbi:hypothetical protein TNCV_3787351 [Trichonephila clavipes]|nr:hypothetical protein TNCV_3787351 [Trichonephila clavipes]
MLFPVVFSEKLGISAICQLATCDDRRPTAGLGPPAYSIIPHVVKRRQSVELVRMIVNHAHLFVSGYCLYEYLTTVIGGVYICVGAQGLLLSRGPGSQEVLRCPCTGQRKVLVKITNKSSSVGGKDRFEVEYCSYM